MMVQEDRDKWLYTSFVGTCNWCGSCNLMFLVDSGQVPPGGPPIVACSGCGRVQIGRDLVVHNERQKRRDVNRRSEILAYSDRLFHERKVLAAKEDLARKEDTGDE